MTGGQPQPGSRARTATSPSRWRPRTWRWPPMRLTSRNWPPRGNGCVPRPRRALRTRTWAGWSSTSARAPARGDRA